MGRKIVYFGHAYTQHRIICHLFPDSSNTDSRPLRGVSFVTDQIHRENNPEEGDFLGETEVFRTEVLVWGGLSGREPESSEILT